MSAYSPDNITQQLVTESGRIGPDIYQFTLNTSPWINLVPKSAWPDEMGDTISMLVYERTISTGANGWANVSNSAGSAGGACALPANSIGFAQTLRTYNLQQQAIESPDLCLNDLRFAFKRREQLSNIMQVLTDNTREIWVNRYRDEYTRVAGHQVICDSSLTEGTTMPESVPTSRLTQGVLSRLYQRLIRQGGGGNPLGRENARPVFGLVTSAEVSDHLILDNADIRQDFRYAKPSENVQPLGVERSYKGFYHLVDDFPARWSFNSGGSVGAKWVRVPHYSTLAGATKGQAYDVNPSYISALYEDAIIFHEDVMTSMVPKPIGGLPNGIKFNPISFMGDFQFKNIPDRSLNPDGIIGFFRGVFSNGTKVTAPRFGYVVRCLTANPTLDLDA